MFLIERFTDNDEPDADPAPGRSREIICAIEVHQAGAESGAVIGGVGRQDYLLTHVIEFVLPEFDGAQPSVYVSQSNLYEKYAPLSL